MNNESRWQECIDSGASLKVTPDLFKAMSLIDTAQGRIRFLDENTVKESNVNYLFENYYSSALELLHALVLILGYKVINHICLGYYLRDILEKQELFRLFNDCRSNRNSLVYYGRKMDFEIALSNIEKCKKFIEKLQIILDEKMR